MGSGNCAFWAPGTFDIGDDNVAFVIDPDGDPEDKVRNAADGRVDEFMGMIHACLLPLVIQVDSRAS